MQTAFQSFLFIMSPQVHPGYGAFFSRLSRKDATSLHHVDWHGAVGSQIEVLSSGHMTVPLPLERPFLPTPTLQMAHHSRQLLQVTCLVAPTPSHLLDSIARCWKTFGKRREQGWKEQQEGNEIFAQ